MPVAVGTIDLIRGTNIAFPDVDGSGGAVAQALLDVQAEATTGVFEYHIYDVSGVIAEIHITPGTPVPTFGWLVVFNDEADNNVYISPALSDVDPYYEVGLNIAVAGTLKIYALNMGATPTRAKITIKFVDQRVAIVNVSNMPDGNYGDATISGSGTVISVTRVAGVTPSAFILTLLNDPDAATARATLGIPADTGITQLTGPITAGPGSGSQATSIAASVALPGSPTTTTQSAGDNSTKIATTAFVAGEVAQAVIGLLEFKGDAACASFPDYPAANIGDSYVVTDAGKIGGASGKDVEVGDMIIASEDSIGGDEATVGNDWFVLEHNLAGALLTANNLSDVTNAASARSNLGLGAMATQSAVTLTGDVTGTGAGSFAATIANNAIVTAKILDAAVTLAKMANMATASLIYRKTAAAGVPEVNTLATLKSDLNVGYTLYAHTAGGNPAASTTYYYGGRYGTVIQTTGTFARMFFPVAGTITAITSGLTWVTAGGSANQSLYIRINNTTDYTISTTYDIASGAANITNFGTVALSIAVAAGDYFEIKWVTPAWAVPATSTIWMHTLFIKL